MLLRMPDETLFALLAVIQIVLMVEMIHPTDLSRQEAENQHCTQESSHLILMCRVKHLLTTALQWYQDLSGQTLFCYTIT